MNFNGKEFELYNADAYEFVNKLKKEKTQVNHIITDPPYNISRENNFSTMSSAKRKGIYFGDWDEEFDLYSWIPKYGQLVKAGGSIIIFTSYRHISYIVDVLEEAGFIVKDIIKWIKKNPMPRNISRRYVQDTEFAIWAIKPGKKWIFNKPDHISYLRSEFRTAVVSGRERKQHPTQKSYQLMSEIVKIHSNEGDVILDPFMGTGTTGIASIKNDRKFIGVEISEDYFFIAKERFDDIIKGKN